MNEEVLRSLFKEATANYSRKFDIEERLIDFGVNIIKMSEKISDSLAGNYLKKQLIRSGLAPALLYAEALGAESRKDFIHKLKVALQEMRETAVSLKLLHKANLILDAELADKLQKELNELISIFVKSIDTARNNLGKK